ncbi:MAG: 1-deoxy-D-xylulose-5-phosphate synthase, partial [Actinobacteria bacterium]|nr:1-deoxy-D-xylulose-5-phosphate synthase [Actinomycetota bacterium]
ELEQMLNDAVELADDGPLVIRYPRGGAPRAADGVGSGLHARKVVAPTEPASVVICAIGRMVATAETAAGKLAADGINCTVWDVRSCVPLDPAMLDDAGQHQLVVTIEDGIVEGGIGSMLTRSVSDRLSSSDGQPTFVNLGLPTVFIPHGAPDDLFEKFDLDADNIASRIRLALG